MNHTPSLRQVILSAAGQDVRRCMGCLDCDIPTADVDIPLGSLVQMATYNDEEALTSRTLWSEAVLQQARHACLHGLNLHAIILALRSEAQRRGII